MHFVYILYSKQLNKFYVGETENVNNRLLWHQEKKFTKAYSTLATDWQLLLTFMVANRTEARKLELYIKKMKSAVFIRNICTDELFRNNFKKIVLDKFNIYIN